MRQNKYFYTVVILLLILFSCQTNKAPRWISEPPLDDELYIYIVGIGENEDVFTSVVDQLKDRFNIEDNDYLSEMLLKLLKDSYDQTPEANDNKISVLDRWLNEDLIYILVRVDRSYFEPIMELYTTRLDEMLNYQHEDEVEADLLLEDGELFKAAGLYLSALEYMLKQNDPFYDLSIISVLDKLSSILNKINYSNFEKFSLLKIAHPILEDKLLITYQPTENESFDGFLYSVGFIEGWKPRGRVVIIPIRDNNLEFIPPQPKISGKFTINATLNLDSFLTVVEPWSDRDGLSAYIEIYMETVHDILVKSVISFDYDAVSDLQTFPKIISFTNNFVSEGVVRFLLEQDQNVLTSPFEYKNEPLISYIREVNRETLSSYRYMILGGAITRGSEEYEGGTLVTLSSSFSLVDLYEYTVLVTKNITSEFLIQDGEEDLVYLDLGLKMGELIYNLSF